MVTDDDLDRVAKVLWSEVYEASFRGKSRGRFCLTREQLKAAIGVQRLHASTIERFQDIALKCGLVVIDLDDLFPCVEVDIMRRYRRPPMDVFLNFFPEGEREERSEEEEEE